MKDILKYFINSNEKLELAKELGLHQQVHLLEFRKECLGLNFKPVSIGEIKKRLGESWSIKVKNCWVNDFEYPIPYGAMLAQKEAGEKGILHHRIWYPVEINPIKDFFVGAKDFFDVLNDPIITGYDRAGKLIEIYAWNENDIYE